MSAPEPLTPPDCDVRDFDGFPLNAERLMSSELVALSTGDEFKAAVMLWCRAWKQVPAASLPDDDRTLAAFAGVSPQKWLKIRPMALRGFVKCLDGRLYHPMLASEAVKTSATKAKYKARREADAKRLNEWRCNKRGNAVETVNETPPETRFTPVSETRFVRSVHVHVHKHKEDTKQQIQNPASARELLLDRLAREMNLDLSGLHRRLNFVQFPSIFHKWVEAGCDAERDIWPEIKRLASRGKPINSPQFFEPAVLAARDARLKETQKPVPPEVLADRLRVYSEHGLWPAEWGPKPDGAERAA